MTKRYQGTVSFTIGEPGRHDRDDRLQRTSGPQRRVGPDPLSESMKDRHRRLNLCRKCPPGVDARMYCSREGSHGGKYDGNATSGSAASHPMITPAHAPAGPDARRDFLRDNAERVVNREANP
jgi:hypothetical protein